MTVSLRDRNRRAAIDQVRSVAFDLMSTHGFTTVTVEQIAAQSSVSPSTVYRYFGTKEALVLSADRPTKLVERVTRDESPRTALAAFARAASKVWGNDESVAVELALVQANSALLVALERQLLDQRPALGESFAARRGATSVGTRDQANAAAALAVLMTMLPRWQSGSGDRKSLDKLLTKAFTALDV
jgi:AcrR family transcriptional regulator